MKRSLSGLRDGCKRPTTSANRWTNSLFEAITDPTLIVSKDDSITVIKDKYPKSRHHFLVIPNKTSANSVSDLVRSDLKTLEKMLILATDLSSKVDTKSEFRFGFHTIPSLRPLHLHVISQDFVSDYLKTKKHYNSFTTEFFVDLKTVIENLKTEGRVGTKTREECHAMLRADLICHLCRSKADNIPKLKTHLLSHCSKNI